MDVVKVGKKVPNIGVGLINDVLYKNDLFLFVIEYLDDIFACFLWLSGGVSLGHGVVVFKGRSKKQTLVVIVCCCSLLFACLSVLGVVFSFLACALFVVAVVMCVCLDCLSVSPGGW